ncbi:DMT family transporter [Clostridium bornimense]|uniref:DMT family transporter n=1 Tax=Clostridium bornimense TaxID=1216932 RepID=UPI001C10A2E9|nr:DMT family transporter [Clostridium bornimense]MBU5316994.1 DMT family transporter [Clostridium bornimense]
MYNLLSIFIGALIGLMVYFNGILSIYLGNYTSSVIVHLVGLIGIILVLICTKSKLKFDRSISLFLYSAGVIGVFTVLFTNIGFMSVGASLTIALSLLGQTISAIIIDHYGLLGVNVIKFNKKKLIGLSIITIGIIIMTIY